MSTRTFFFEDKHCLSFLADDRLPDGGILLPSGKVPIDAIELVNDGPV